MLALLTAGAVLAAGVLLPIAFGGGVAAAAEGPAPTPTEYRVLDTEHSDTIATFWDDGDWNLGSKADVDGNLGVRFPADGILVHVNDLARYDSWPVGYEFVAPAGSTVWLAPMTRMGGVVWPGFSTESVPAGALAGEITFTLGEVAGPGDVELWTTSSFGGVQERLWSSDEAVKSFSRPISTHLHANWAFTQPGTYQLTVTASATTAEGAPVSDTQTYTFVAGPLPEQVTTSTALRVDGESTVTEGTTVELHATVTPASVEGYVEFRDGATVLGHVEAADGDAELETSDLGIGTHTVTAHFVPKVANFTTASDSNVVTVTVTNDTGVPFSITGIQESYAPGDTLTANLVGARLDPNAAAYGQKFRWRLVPPGWDGNLARTTIPVRASLETGYSQTVDMSVDGYGLVGYLLNCRTSSSTCSSNDIVAQTPIVLINVQNESTPPVVSVASGNPEAFYPADTIGLEASGLDLAEGETVQWAYRGYSPWASTFPASLGAVPDESSLNLTQKSPASTATDFAAIQILRDGVAVRQSAPIQITSAKFEFLIDGLQGLYMAGATTAVNAQIDPAREGDADFAYRWLAYPTSTDLLFNRNAEVWGEGSGTIPPLQREVQVADDGKHLVLVATKAGFTNTGGTALAGEVARSETLRVYVTDDPDAQLFFFNSLSAHYHTGDAINLDLTVAPEPLEGDQIVWEWQWPGADWEPMPGVSGQSHALAGEQALEGLQIRATLSFADPEREAMVAGPVTIEVDDHGSAAPQKPTIAGETSYIAGEPLDLSLSLPANGPTMLTDHLWERRSAGSEEWVAVEGESGTSLTTPTTPADNGASYRVSILKPTGEVAYGPSPAATINIIEVGGLTVTGVQDLYQPGETLTATEVGRELGANEQFRWAYVSKVDGKAAYTGVAGNTFEQVVDAAWDGLQIYVRVYNTSSRQYVAESEPVTLHVEMQGSVPALDLGGKTTFWFGDPFTAAASGLDGIPEGATVRARLGFGLPLENVPAPTSVEGDVWTFLPSQYHASVSMNVTLEVVLDDVVLASSQPYEIEAKPREVLLQGAQSVYRAGQTMSVSGTVYPEIDAASYAWCWGSPFQTPPGAAGGGDCTATTPDEDGVFHFEKELALVDDSKQLYLAVYPQPPLVDDQLAAFGMKAPLAVANLEVRVVDLASEDQLLVLANLAGHYHQGNTIELNAFADPAAADTDTFAWEWLWPGGEWAPIPGAPATSETTLTAEQALDGVQVRVKLNVTGTETVYTSEPATIEVDDHGAAARQIVTLAGETSVTEGDTVTLSRELPENGATVLTGHQWEKKPADGDWAVIAVESEAQLSFPATLADDGAEYRVSILKPDGTIAYGPSPAVTLGVQAGAPAATVPAAPRQPGITADGARVSVSWAAPADGGSAITGYLVTLTPESGEPIERSAAPDADSVTFAEVPAGSWTATVVAINEIGNSAASMSSASVTVAAAEPEPEPDVAAPAVTAQPTDVSVQAGQDAVFAAAASGVPAPSVRWQSKTAEGDWSDVAGAADVALTLTDVDEGQSGTQYRAVFTNSEGMATTDAATLTVTPAAPDDPEPVAPVVTEQPSDVSVAAGEDAAFTAAASGDPAPSVQWQAKADGGSWREIAGAADTTLTVSNVTVDESGTQYRAVFTNPAGSVATNPAVLTVTPIDLGEPDLVAPIVTTHPANVSVTAGEAAAFTAAASGDPAPSVQWQSTTGDGGWADIAGATDATLTVADATVEQSGLRYRAVFTNAVGSATTGVATLTVAAPVPTEPEPSEPAEPEQPSFTPDPPVASADDLPAALADALVIVQVDGLTAKVMIPGAEAGEWFFVHGYSTPTELGWYQTDLQSSFVVDLTALPAGEHTLVVTDADGELRGYRTVTIPAEETPGVPDDDSDGDQDDDADEGGELPVTGAAGPVPLVLLALSMVGAGALLVGRRRRSAT